MSKERNKLNVAIVGCGCVAGYGHAPAIVRSQDLNCVAYVDMNLSRAEDFSHRFGGGDVYDDYRKVLERKDVDIVAILIKPSAHSQIATDALEAGKHVFTEKPISSDVAGGEEMIAAAKSAGKKLFVGFILRYTGVFQKMAEVIQSGRIGKPQIYRMKCFERYGSGDSFSWNRALAAIRDISPGIDCGIHYIDLMRWFSGAEAIRVQGMGARINPDVPEGMFDWESFQIEFDNGCRGIYEVGWGFSFPTSHPRQAIGPQGYVGIRMGVTEEGEESGAELVFCPCDGKEEVIARSAWKGFDGEWAHFARMVQEDLDPYPALSNALESLRIVEAAHRAAVEGISIEL